MDKFQQQAVSTDQNSSIIIRNPEVTTTMVVHQYFRRYPIVMMCPFCKTLTKTKVRKAHPCLDLLCIFCCFCAMSCKKKYHTCTNCGQYLGMCDV